MDGWAGFHRGQGPRARPFDTHFEGLMAARNPALAPRALALESHTIVLEPSVLAFQSSVLALESSALVLESLVRRDPGPPE